MNKDPLKDLRSDALNPSLGKEGNTLFIVGRIRWIKRCSWWGWHAVLPSQCVCVCESIPWWLCLGFRWHPEFICVYIHKSGGISWVMSAGFGRGGFSAFPVSACEPKHWGDQVRVLFYFIFSCNGHFTSTLINVFIADLMRTVHGWLVKLFYFINLGWNLLCRLRTGVTYKRCDAAAGRVGSIIITAWI